MHLLFKNNNAYLGEVEGGRLKINLKQVCGKFSISDILHPRGKKKITIMQRKSTKEATKQLE